MTDPCSTLLPTPLMAGDNVKKQGQWRKKHQMEKAGPDFEDQLITIDTPSDGYTPWVMADGGESGQKGKLPSLFTGT